MTSHDGDKRPEWWWWYCSIAAGDRFGDDDADNDIDDDDNGVAIAPDFQSSVELKLSQFFMEKPLAFVIIKLLLDVFVNNMAALFWDGRNDNAAGVS